MHAIGIFSYPQNEELPFIFFGRRFSIHRINCGIQIGLANSLKGFILYLLIFYVQPYKLFEGSNHMSDEDLLRSMEFCSDLSDEELRMIRSMAEEVNLAVGEYVIEENKPCDFIYIIADGSVEVTKSGAHIVMLKKGDAIGELSFLDKHLPSASVCAREDTTLVMISHRELDKLMKKNLGKDQGH
jgi:CRP-like cAMP-binding protein